MGKHAAPETCGQIYIYIYIYMYIYIYIKYLQTRIWKTNKTNEDNANTCGQIQQNIETCRQMQNAYQKCEQKWNNKEHIG